ncbi:MAG: TIGR02646 family protein [Candidatus Aminicenantes bacterium]|nr:TIGR02646 family protein [Candidatus Aminicenantes bacterium]NIM80947.1 TIGR02646 family protein [Candidatus Aminicenantes bacterium]NIN20329.1 TIGR02646 family protein [Candidatus Aminicenantes bacterium]NIN44104.1 TIGR02646 family protein [Candidatus Aminicenantes bacterium]NIN86917.1 TIGR02646 family protein [Candidatus Aminicenantes bacterium]
MKYIKKQNEPTSLRQFRSIPGAVYDAYRDKDELRQALMKEQGFICCYCMQRIKFETSHIEHWKPQSLYPGYQLDYKNLLAVCDGNDGKPQHLQHCDRRKGKQEITINPTNLNCETLVKFRSNGETYSHDETIDNELNAILNLNIQTLVTNRKYILDPVIRKLTAENPDGIPSKTALKKEIRKWETLGADGKYKPYLRIVIFFLEKRLTKYT